MTARHISSRDSNAAETPRAKVHVRRFYPDGPIGEALFTLLYRIIVGIAAVVLAAIPAFVIGFLNGWQVTDAILVVVAAVVGATIVVAEHLRLAIYGRYARSRVVVYQVTWPTPRVRYSPGVYQIQESRMYLSTKRLMDIVLAFLGLVILAPVFVIIAILIKLDSPGPILYAQRRIGRFGKPFRMYKFRVTRDPWDETVLPEGEVERAFRAGGWISTVDYDLTRVGEFLHRVALDELPQLFNVLVGDMSLVGPRPRPVESPRPELPHIFDLAPWVSPGVTGIWAVSGGFVTNKTSEADLFILERRYVESRSLMLDLMVLLRTVPAVLRSSRY